MMKIGRFFQIVALILLAAGAQPAASAVWQWSTTASNNATADPNIDWSEGQSPSSVNDSARAMMSAIAKWNQDTSGSFEALGTGSAMTFTSASGFTSLASLNGQRITFINAAATNVAGVTLSVDGLPAALIRSANNVPVPAGALVFGAVYTVTYYLFDNSYHLWDFYNNTFNIPLGGILQSTLPTPPNGNFVAAAGQCLSTTTFATYWAALGSPGSGGCGGGAFQMPLDARGRVLVGVDNLGGTAANRLTSASPGCGTVMQSAGASCANGLQLQTLTLAQIPTGITSTGGALSVTTTTGVILLSNGIGAQNLASGTNGFGWSNNPTVGAVGATGTTSTQSVASTNTGGGSHSTVDPNAAVYIYVRVL